MATSAIKTALITGASRGMGLGYAEHYLRRGWRVVATSTNRDPGADLSRLQQQFGEQLRCAPLQLEQPASIAALADRVPQLEHPVDLLINNAGVSVAEPLEDWSAETLLQQFQINASGPALLVQALAGRLAAGAKVVNITSGMGSLELNIDPAGPLAGYAASKAALNLLTRRLAAMLRPRGVTVVAINPGWVRTDMGGSDAPASVSEAVEQITATIEKLTLDQTGALMESNGEPMAF